MKLQYQLSSGTWTNCDNRTDEFLNRAIALSDKDTVMEKLANGGTVRNDASDWYSNCRDGEVVETARKIRQQQASATITCEACGSTGQSGVYPFSTIPGSVCDDCA